MVTIKEVKTAVAVAIGGAFGFVIALIWRDIIIGLLNMAELNVQKFNDIAGATIAIIVALIITLICIIGIIYISKWGGIEKK